PSSDAICEATPLEREFYANRIVLVYHPLQETPLESSLVRGIWLRNYATQDIDYTVTVEPVTLPPGKPENTALKAEKACCKELSILLFTNTTFWIRLSKGDRLVAELFLPKTLSLPFPFSLQWWRGFIIGLVERSPRIMMNTMMLSTVAMVPRELMPAIAAALGFMKAYQVYNQRGEIFNATMALGNLTAMGLIYRGMADGYRLQGKNGFATICDNLSQTFLDKAKEVAADLGLRLVMDVTLEDVKTALGLRKASEYEQGYATGKVVGAMVEAVTYAATFATVCYEFSTARDMLTSAGEAGQLSSSSVLKRFAQGLYAWVTPAIWDLTETGIRFGAWLKGKLNLPDVSKLIFADQASKSFGETVGRALETLPDGGEPEEIAKGASNIVDKVTMDEDIPEDIGVRILSILSKMGEEYVGREDAAETIVEAWKRVSELEAWGREEEPGKLLMDWLGSLEKEKSDEALDALQKFAGLGEEELNSLGKALGKIGDSFENGLKLFDTYFKTIELEQYGEKVANALAETVSKNPEVLGIWRDAIEERFKILVDISTLGNGNLKIEDKVGDGHGQVSPGHYWVQVISETLGRKVDEGLRILRPEERALTFENVEAGENYILILRDVNVENFFERVKIRDASGEYGKTIGEWLAEKYGLSGFSFMKESGDTYLIMGGEKVANVEAGLKGGPGYSYLEFKITDLNGEARTFHIGWKNGEPSFSIMFSENPYIIKEFSQKTVRGGERIVARLIYLKYLEVGEEMSTIFPISRTEPDWSFLNTFRTDEKIISIQRGSVWLEGPLRDIFGGETVDELKSDKARVALIYKHVDEVIVKPAYPAKLEVQNLPEGSEALGFLVLRMDKELSTNIAEDTVISLGGNVMKKTERTYLTDLSITKGSYSRVLQADVTFTSLGPYLQMKAKTIGGLDLIYRFEYDQKAGSVIYNPFIEIKGKEIAVSSIVKFEVLPDVKYLGDIACIQAETYKIIGLSKELPKYFDERASHAWFVASFLKYEFEKVYAGWEIEKMECSYGEETETSARFDAVVIEPDKKRVILEFKTIYEGTKEKDLIEQAAKYIRICDEDPDYFGIHYVFQLDQNNEIPQEGMKGLYHALNEFLNTGKLKLPDGTVLLNVSREEANEVLKILAWTGGYLP
ncbi:MAG: hypothetical protein QW491_14775, partial [Thermoproteota archaeon]